MWLWNITDWASKLAGDRTHEWGSRWLLRSKSKLQTLSFSPPPHVFLQKKAFFRFCGRDPSKMTILAPSRKTVRIGLYRGVEKGPKSTFFGWSGFGDFGFSTKLCASHLARPTPVVIASEIIGFVTTNHHIRKCIFDDLRWLIAERSLVSTPRPHDFIKSWSSHHDRKTWKMRVSKKTRFLHFSKYEFFFDFFKKNLATKKVKNEGFSTPP